MPVERSVKEIFADAIELAGAERAAFLERECEGDAALRARVEFLLGVHAGGSKFLASPTGSAAAAERSVREVPGTRVGPYTLREEIGEGGFGVVFMAEQEQPIRRRVALKVIKLGMDTKAVIARFEAERQALAMMDHPNIARVLDAGATESGRPYFVMELVRGEPITAYCDRNNLTVEARLRLFGQVCHAVQHAHQKGIIHRDIKPGNILVTRTESGPTPKVIDFGIAKATTARLTEKTLFTEHRQLLGTPEYMSPEQADLAAADIDTRTDIYSLGVLLYELLTGALPYDPKRLRSAAFGEIQRIIREEEPAKPSTRLSTLEALPSVAACRQTDPKRLGALIRGDLDWIVMKALEKDRARRYETASGLAMDVQRHLAGEPVLAAPPGRVYRARRFLRRHRVGVAAGALVVLSLLAGLAGTTTFAVREARQRAVAEQRTDQTRKVADFQARMLRGIDPEAMGRAITGRFRDEVRAGLEREYLGQWPDRRPRTGDEVLAELAAFDARAAAAAGVDVARGALEQFVLRPAADAIGTEFAAQPVVQAQLHDAVGSIYFALGMYGEGEPHLQLALDIRARALGRRNAQTAESMGALADVLRARADLGAAEALHREALEVRRGLFGSQHAAVARSLHSLAQVLQDRGHYAQAEPLFRESLALDRALLGEEHPDTLESAADLAMLLRSRAQFAEAEPLLRRTLAVRRRLFGDMNEDVAASLTDLARLLHDKGLLAEAERLLREALAIDRAVLGGEHPVVAEVLVNLAQVLAAQRDIAGAKELYQEALAIDRRRLGDRHPSVALGLHELAVMLYERGEGAEAEPLLREALDISRAASPGDHPHTAMYLHHLGNTLLFQQPEEGERMLRESAEMYRTHPDWNPLEFLATLLSLAKVEFAGDRPAEAAETLRQGIAARRASMPEGSPDLAEFLENAGAAMAEVDALADAEPLFREALAISQAAGADQDQPTAKYLHHLGAILQRLGSLEEAERVVLDSLVLYRARPDWNPREHTHALKVLGDIYTAQGRTPESVRTILDRLAIERTILPTGSPDLINQLELTGTLLQQLEAFAEAEPLFCEVLQYRRLLEPEETMAAGMYLRVIGELRMKLNNNPGAEEVLLEAASIFRGSDYAMQHRDVMWDLNRIYTADGRTEQALAAAREALDAHLRVTTPGSADRAPGLDNIARGLLTLNAPAEAEPLLRESLAIREEHFPEGHPKGWLRHNTGSLLGAALAGQGRFAEAEPLLLSTYEGMKGDPNMPVPTAGGADRRREALERIVTLYEAWDAAEPGQGHDAKAAEWRGKLDSPR